MQSIFDTSGKFLALATLESICRPPETGSFSCNLLPGQLCRQLSLAGLKQVFLRHPREQIKAAGDQSSPACLMTGSQTCAVFSVEVLVKQDVISPVRIILELFRSSIDRALAVGVTQKHACVAAADFLSHLKQIHVIARAGWELDPKVWSIERIHLKQCSYDQSVHRHPDRSPPVGVAAKHTGIRLCRKVLHFVFLSAQIKHEGMLQVIF